MLFWRSQSRILIWYSLWMGGGGAVIQPTGVVKLVLGASWDGGGEKWTFIEMKEIPMTKALSRCNQAAPGPTKNPKRRGSCVREPFTKGKVSPPPHPGRWASRRNAPALARAGVAGVCKGIRASASHYHSVSSRGSLARIGLETIWVRRGRSTGLFRVASRQWLLLFIPSKNCSGN